MHAETATAEPALRVNPSLPAVKTTVISVIIPVYNEFVHVADVIERVLRAPFPPNTRKELIVVDDGSTDGTSDVLRQMNHAQVKVHHAMLNFGKGTALRVGLKYATGDVIVVQDGDQEYDPNELARVITPILEHKADVVYGSRFMGSIDGMYWRYWLANKMLVWTVRLLFGVRLTDEATAYKAFRRQTIQSIPLRCRRFEFCPEVTAKLLRRGITIHEVPITYSARTVAQGKKIRWSDGIQAFWTLLKYRFYF